MLPSAQTALAYGLQVKFFISIEGTKPMRTYRLYYRALDGQMVDSEPFESWDDEEALTLAHEKADRAGIEFWQVARQVMVSAPPDPARG